MTATTTSIPALAVETAALEQVTEDLYRDIHKGIRAELFAVTAAAGRVDPGDADAVRAVGDQWRRVVFVLVSHSEHEDQWVQPVLERHSPTLAAQVAREHPQLEAHMAALEILADRAAEACPADRRLLVHRMYLGFASFT